MVVHGGTTTRALSEDLRRRIIVAREAGAVSGPSPHGHWQPSTFIAALRVEGLAAPFLIEGAVNTEVFTAYLQQVLCPELQLREGDLVILDNHSTYKTASVAELISARGASVRYLPPYSPDLNPIELAFAKLKAHLRQAAARTLNDLQLALAQSLKIQPHPLPGLLPSCPIRDKLNQKCSKIRRAFNAHRRNRPQTRLTVTSVKSSRCSSPPLKRWTFSRMPSLTSRAPRVCSVRTTSARRLPENSFSSSLGASVTPSV